MEKAVIGPKVGDLSRVAFGGSEPSSMTPSALVSYFEKWGQWESGDGRWGAVGAVGDVI